MEPDLLTELQPIAKSFHEERDIDMINLDV
jgi:hypothetical protein